MTNYKMRLRLLPLMYQLEMFCVNNLVSPSSHFVLSDFIAFSSSSTQSADSEKIRHTGSNTNSSFISIGCLNLQLSVQSIKDHLFKYFFQHFMDHFVSQKHITSRAIIEHHSKPV